MSAATPTTPSPHDVTLSENERRELLPLLRAVWGIAAERTRRAERSRGSRSSCSVVERDEHAASITGQGGA